MREPVRVDSDYELPFFSEARQDIFSARKLGRHRDYDRAALVRSRLYFLFHLEGPHRLHHDVVGCR